MICKSCGAEISREALACPHCGHAYNTFWAAYRRRSRIVAWGCLPVILLFFAFIIWAGH
jgi:predicted RNA-binding Zn-ribbon protein involved in translation (DUF1610 family)